MEQRAVMGLWLGVALVMGPFLARSAHGQMEMGTAFTYQGQLKQDGVPFQGTADIEFTLWGDETAGTRHGPILSKPGQAVVNGLFTVALDFEQGAFNGNARWLEIRARAGGGAFETLTPRQPLTPTPYALVAAGLRLPITAVANSGTPALDITNNGAGSGLVARHAGTGNFGILGGPEDGVYGQSADETGVTGQSTTGGGVFGGSITGNGVMGESVTGSGVYGYSADQWGVTGHSTTGKGVTGESSTDTGVDGVSDTGWGVYGHLVGGPAGGLGSSIAGVVGFGNGNLAGQFNGGVKINGDLDVDGGLLTSTQASFGDVQISGLLDVDALDVSGSATLAGLLLTGPMSGTSAELTSYLTVGGNLHVTGTLSKGAGSFKIDHPLDPANKYLYHSFVESPDMMNVYNGNAALDAKGEAWVEMPKWFEALNRDCRYQLTPIGGPGPNLYVAEEVKGNRFKIAGGTPGLKVSWQLTGIRQDPYANAHRIRVEVDKAPAERGYFLHPKPYGLPAEAGMGHVRRPQVSALAGAAEKGGAR